MKAEEWGGTSNQYPCPTKIEKKRREKGLPANNGANKKGTADLLAASQKRGGEKSNPGTYGACGKKKRFN